LTVPQFATQDFFARLQGLNLLEVFLQEMKEFAHPCRQVIAASPVSVLDFTAA